MTNEIVYFGGEDAHIREGDRTLCGIPLADKVYQTGSDLGPLTICEECDLRNPEKTNAEIVATIEAVVPGFEQSGDSPAGYLDRAQLIALKEFIEDHKSEVESDA